MIQPTKVTLISLFALLSIIAITQPAHTTHKLKEPDSIKQHEPSKNDQTALKITLGLGALGALSAGLNCFQ